MPWLAERAGNNKVWHPPEVGEQVVVVSPSGNLSAGFVLSGSIFFNDFPANGTDPTKTITTFEDGAVIEYDRTAHAYSVTPPSSGKVTLQVGSNSKAVVENNDVTLSFGSGTSLVLNSSGITLMVGSVTLSLSSSGVTINGQTSITGATSVTGNVAASGNVTAGGDVQSGTVTLKTHVHTGGTLSGLTGPGQG